MTTVSIGDCIKDTGYLAEYTNVDFLSLPKNNNASETIEQNQKKKSEKIKSESEEENENLKSQIDDLTKARIPKNLYPHESRPKKTDQKSLGIQTVRVFDFRADHCLLRGLSQSSIGFCYLYHPYFESKMLSFNVISRRRDRDGIKSNIG